MRKILLSIIVFMLAIPSLAQWRTEQDASSIISQPTRCIRGDSIHYTAGLYYPIHYGKTAVSCKAVVLNPTGTDGYLNVHLKGDPTAARYKMFIDNDGYLNGGGEFDFIDSAGTTVLLDTNLYIFPYYYKNP